MMKGLISEIDELFVTILKTNNTLEALEKIQKVQLLVQSMYYQLWLKYHKEKG